MEYSFVLSYLSNYDDYLIYLKIFYRKRLLGVTYRGFQRTKENNKPFQSQKKHRRFELFMLIERKITRNKRIKGIERI